MDVNKELHEILTDFNYIDFVYGIMKMFKWLDFVLEVIIIGGYSIKQLSVICDILFLEFLFSIMLIVP